MFGRKRGAGRSAGQRVSALLALGPGCAGGGYGACGTARLGHAKGNPVVDLVREPANRPRTKMDGVREPPLGHGSVEGGLLETTAPEYLVAADDLQRMLVDCNGPRWTARLEGWRRAVILHGKQARACRIWERSPRGERANFAAGL
jgi:hypothetical protein